MGVFLVILLIDKFIYTFFSSESSSSLGRCQEKDEEVQHGNKFWNQRINQECRRVEKEASAAGLEKAIEKVPLLNIEYELMLNF